MDLPRTHPIWLVVFAALTIAAGAGAYLMYRDIYKTEPEQGLQAQYFKDEDEYQKKEKNLQEQQAKLEHWRQVTGLHIDEAERYLGVAKEGNKSTLEPAVPTAETQLANFPNAINYLVGKVGDERDTAMKAVDAILNTRNEITQLRKDIEGIEKAAQAKRAGIEKQIADLRAQTDAAQTASRNQIKALEQQMETDQASLETFRKKWEEDRIPLEQRLKRLTEIERGLREKETAVTGFHEPPDGEVLTVNYESGRVTISLGSDNYREIEPNMLFDIYGQGKGEKAAPKATVRIISVGKNISETVLTKRPERTANEVVAHDYVEPKVHFVAQPKFAFAGCFGPKTRLTANELGLLARQWGGTVGPEIEVDTRFLVVGIADPKLLGDNPTADEIKAAESGARAIDMAVQYGVTVLTVEKFMKLIHND